MAIIYKKKWDFRRGDVTSWGDCEALYFSICFAAHFTLGDPLIYRPPGPAGTFLQSFGDAVVPQALRFSYHIVLGDLNIHLASIVGNQV